MDSMVGIAINGAFVMNNFTIGARTLDRRLIVGNKCIHLANHVCSQRFYDASIKIVVLLLKGNVIVK